MVKRVILGRTGEEKIVDLIRSIDDKASVSHTRPAGTKVLDDDEDLIWSRPDGTAHSVRDIDEELEGARGRIEEAEVALGETQVRLEGAEQIVADTREDLTRVETEVIPGAVADLEAADQAAQEQFDELDARLGDFATDEALAPIRQALSDAQAAVESAQGVAESANQAANAASQAALEAAGIAESKGRVIIQETEPVGEDRNAANIWIKPIPDNPATEIEEKAITYVYLEASNEWVPTSSDELAQAAQNALDAREAAQQAQQRADTAISNAATAQAAAEAAQRTADDATLEAREAHNEAVAAQSTADDAMSRATSPTSNMIHNGSGHFGNENFTANGWNRYPEDAPAGAGASFGITYPGVIWLDKHLAVDPSRRYRMAATVRQSNPDYSGSDRYYMALLPYDSDGQSIHTLDYVRFSGSETTLAAPLKFGDTTVTVTSAGGWLPGYSTKQIAFYNWVDGSGKHWGREYTKTRRAFTAIEGNVITLAAPWNGSELPVGTDVGQAGTGGSYMYPLVTAHIPHEWTPYESLVIGGIHTDLSAVATRAFPAATASVRAGFLLNYTNQTESRHRVANVGFFDITEAVAAQEAADAAQARADEAMTEASEAKGLAEDAVREVGDTVRDTVIEYAVGTSETVAPTSGWSTSTPTRTPGSFVWMRTIVTYADGDTSTTSPALLTGNDGAKGDRGATGAKGDKGDKGDRGSDGVAGKDGVGLSSTALAYALSTSGTTAPSSGWTATPPTPVKGRYLWTRTIWTYTDSSKETGYSVAYLATDGAKGNDGVAGKDGVGIKSTAITYAASSSGTTAPSSGWSSQPPAAAAGQYVWTRTIWTYTDNSTETGYSVGKIGDTGAKGATGSTGSKGDKGDQGDTGVSVSSVTPFFRTVSRSSGAPAQPSGMTPSGWSTAEPAWSPNTKLYRAERIIYSNGTVSWTEPTLVAAYEGIVQVQTSVNGKNSITRSTSNASGSGVVAGDAWYKVDDNGDTIAMWIWDGSKWVASKVRNEMIDTIDVNKLKVHDDLEVIGDAVIDKIWADGIAAKAITAQQVTVAPGNSFPDPSGLNVGTRNSMGGTAWSWDDAGKYWKRAAATGGTTQFNAYLNTTTGYDSGSLTPGATYRIAYDVWVNGSTASSNDQARAAIYYRKVDGSTSFVADGSTADSISTNQWAHIERTWVAPSDAVSGGFSLQLIRTNGTATEVRIRNPFVGVKAGAVLIEDGAVTTPKLEVTEDMSAAIVNAMSVNAKKLVVSEEAVLNHVTAIGQTVVDDINVQGKLIGTDGVFTGTVDFENINVTDEVLASRISGEHLYGTQIEGGMIYTTHAGNGQVILSDEGYVDSNSRGKYPGIRILPRDTSELVTPPGIGPNENGFIITGGRNVSGGRGFSIYGPRSTQLRYIQGDAYSTVSVSGGSAYINSDDGVGNRGHVQAASDHARVRANAADGAYGTIEASSSYAVAATRDPSGNYMSQIRSNGREAYMWSTGSDGLGRILSVDSGGVWVKAERDDGSGYWDHINLLGDDWDTVDLASGWSPRSAGGYFKGLRVRRLGGSLEINGAVQGGSAKSKIGNITNPRLRPKYDTFVVTTLAGGGLGQAYIAKDGGIVHSYGANKPGFLAINVSIPLN